MGAEGVRACAKCSPVCSKPGTHVRACGRLSLARCPHANAVVRARAPKREREVEKEQRRRHRYDTAECARTTVCPQYMRSTCPPTCLLANTSLCLCCKPLPFAVDIVFWACVCASARANAQSGETGRDATLHKKACSHARDGIWQGRKRTATQIVSFVFRKTFSRSSDGTAAVARN
eukprot:806056-Pleurochrysis_carterae.AAC.2